MILNDAMSSISAQSREIIEYIFLEENQKPVNRGDSVLILINNTFSDNEI